MKLIQKLNKLIPEKDTMESRNAEYTKLLRSRMRCHNYGRQPEQEKTEKDAEK